MRLLYPPRDSNDASKRIVHRLNALSTYGAGQCPVPGCGQPTQAAAGKGLSATHCRYHVQFRNRHGSFWKRTYTAADLKPFRNAARAIVRENKAHPLIDSALYGLNRLMCWSGPSVRVVDTLRMAPDRKAKAALRRLWEAEVPEERLLINHLAITASLSVDPIGPGGDPEEFRLVQVAKACFRLASGYHADYGEGSRYDRYPRSAGLMLRILGRLIDGECSHAAAAFVPNIVVRARGRRWEAA